MVLLEYGASNYFSFKEGFEVSLRLNSKCPPAISKGKPFSNVLCVKGGNASGKTNVLKALNFIKEFGTDSFSIKPDEEIMVEPHFFNEEPCFFYIVFEINGIEYRYDLVVTKNEVITEIIHKKSKKNLKVVERKKNNILVAIGDFRELEGMRLRSNASLISTAFQHEFESILPIYHGINDIYTNVTNYGIHEGVPNREEISKYYHNNPEIFEFVRKQIKECDLGIDNIEIISRDDENGNKMYFPFFTHSSNKQEAALTIYYESSGTKALYDILYLYNIVLKWGGVLVLDEFDINLHPHILPKLIGLFEGKSNTLNAQLIFTTHNAKIMDDLGKYKTFLVNKEDNCSFGYRLDEVPGDILRNDRQISKVYDAGKIGGLNNIEIDEQVQ